MNEIETETVAAQENLSQKFGDSSKIGFFARGRELESVTTNHYYTELESQGFIFEKYIENIINDIIK